MRNLVFMFLLSVFGFVFGQQNGVTIVEKKDSKRHFLYAKNDAEAPRSVFLRVVAKGYRRQADRPIIKTIPPKSEVLMMTLIPLRDTIPSYTYIYVANDEQQDLGVIREKEPNESMGVNEFIESRNLIFTKEGCDKCKYLVDRLQHQRKKFREVRIEEKDWAFKYTLSYLDHRGQKLDTIALPMAMIKGKVIQPIKDINLFVDGVEE